MTTWCPGSGGLRTFSVGDEMRARQENPYGNLRQAVVSCKICSYQGRGLVVRQSYGVDLGGDHVKVPRHKQRETQ